MTDLFTYRPSQKFKGSSYDNSKDHSRLSTQLDRVRALMNDGQWRTLAEIKSEVTGTETALSARLRDLRNEEGRTVLKERVSDGLWKYRIVPRIQSTTEQTETGLRSPNREDAVT